ncbi:uncharacterized protein LOC141732302 isoform X2 [Larus michahellis]|uniref:uncharacterized protein LOC141732302 isoform X2 n=1 Tax=Larus michahellis TaxID=119627 RepID=UPI003D9B4944
MQLQHFNTHPSAVLPWCKWANVRRADLDAAGLIKRGIRNGAAASEGWQEPDGSSLSAKTLGAALAWEGPAEVLVPRQEPAPATVLEALPQLPANLLLLEKLGSGRGSGSESRMLGGARWLCNLSRAWSGGRRGGPGRSVSPGGSVPQPAAGPGTKIPGTGSSQLMNICKCKNIRRRNIQRASSLCLVLNLPRQFRATTAPCPGQLGCRRRTRFRDDLAQSPAICYT